MSIIKNYKVVSRITKEGEVYHKSFLESKVEGRYNEMLPEFIENHPYLLRIQKFNAEFLKEFQICGTHSIECVFNTEI
jgi:hypothetical protein